MSKLSYLEKRESVWGSRYNPSVPFIVFFISQVILHHQGILHKLQDPDSYTLNEKPIP